MSGALQAVYQNLRSFGSPPGQDVYLTSGCYTWVAPAGVTSVSAVAIGGGAPGANGNSFAIFCPCSGFTCRYGIGGGGGGGGGLAYANNITVSPGSSYTVTVQPGNTSGMPSSSFGCFVSASSGSPGVCSGAGNGGGVTIGTGFSGGNGGAGAPASMSNGSYPSQSGAGGGGAAGYASAGGKGGVSGQTCSTANGQTKTGGAGGGGGGGNNCTYRGGAGGGGSNVYGTLSPYCDTAGTGGGLITGGGGVYGGSNAGSSSNTGGSAGAIYGGGGGGGSVQGGVGVAFNKPRGLGGGGAVRIIWPGTTRAYPSTCTNDV